MDKNREQTIVIGVVALIVVVILGGLALLFLSLFAAPTVRPVMITVVPATPLSTATPTAVAVMVYYYR